MIETMTNHEADVVDFQRPAGTAGGGAYNNFYLQWDRISSPAALPTWNVIHVPHRRTEPRSSAACTGHRRDIIMGGEDVHPLQLRRLAGRKREGRHWYAPTRGRLALVDYAARRHRCWASRYADYQRVRRHPQAGIDGWRPHRRSSRHRFIRHGRQDRQPPWASWLPSDRLSDHFVGAPQCRTPRREPFRIALTLPTERSKPSSRSMPRYRRKVGGAPKTRSRHFPAARASGPRTARRARGEGLDPGRSHLPGTNFGDPDSRRWAPPADACATATATLPGR